MDYDLFIQMFLSVVFIYHNFIKLRLVFLFSRSISFFPIFNRVIKNYKKLPIDPTPTPSSRLPILQLDVP